MDNLAKLNSTAHQASGGGREVEVSSLQLRKTQRTRKTQLCVNDCVEIMRNAMANVFKHSTNINFRQKVMHMLQVDSPDMLPFAVGEAVTRLTRSVYGTDCQGGPGSVSSVDTGAAQVVDESLEDDNQDSDQDDDDDKWFKQLAFDGKRYAELMEPEP